MRLNIIILYTALTLHNSYVRRACVSAMQSLPEMSSLGAGHAVQGTESLGEGFSQVGKVLLDGRYGKEQAKEFLRVSGVRLNGIGRQIDESVAKGKLIYLEDGEGDDNWQSLLGALAGIAPELIITRGGYYKLRQKLTEMNWERFGVVAGKDHPPPVMPIHGTLDDSDYCTFDRVEGLADLEPDVLAKLREESKDQAQLAREIARTKQEVIKRLEQNEFTTIVVKGAPTGLAELIKKAGARDKVAVIWTGFMRFDVKYKEFQPKFNVLKDIEASKALLTSGAQIVISTPRLNNAEMGAIVPRIIAEVYAEQSPDVRKGYKGFARLEELVSPAKGTFARRLVSSWDNFYDHQIGKYERRLKRKAELLEDKANGRPVDEKELNKLVTYSEGFSLPKKWTTIQAAVPVQPGQTKAQMRAAIRDLCPIDLFAQPILKGSIRKQCVQEVVPVKIELSPDNQILHMTPSADSKIHVVTGFDTDPLTDDVQRSINYMADGEPLDKRRLAQYQHSSSLQ